MMPLRLALVTSIAGLFLNAAHAQSWPTRPPKIIVSQAAGSTPDILCRILADRLSIGLGHQIIIENRPGGANVIGAQAAARSDPDGYTFFFATAAALASNPHTFKTLSYDPLKDFAPVSMVAKGPFILLAHPSVDAKDLKGIFALDKAAPGKLSIATEGSRNFTGILAGWINKRAKAQLVEVPYTTITAGIQDALAGRVQLISLPIASAAPFIASGELRPIAVSSSKPLDQFESVPPIADTLPGIDLLGWFVLVAPTGTPEPIIARMNQEMKKILDDPAIRKRLVELGTLTDGAGSVEETGQFIKDQFEVWKQAVKDVGLEPQ